MWSIYSDNTVFESDPIRTSFQEKCIFATWIILWICIGFGFILLTAPIAHAAEINPPVESQPFFCRYSLTEWTPLCPDAPLQGAQGPQGQMNMTMNMTLTLPTTYYLHNESDSTNSTLYVISKTFPTKSEANISATTPAGGGEKIIAEFITPIGDPNLNVLVPGTRYWTTYAKVDNDIVGVTKIRHRLYAVNSTTGNRSLIYTFDGTALEDYIEANDDSYTMSNGFVMNTTDRFLMEYSAYSTSVAARTVTIYFDDNARVSHIESPITMQGLQGPPGPAGTAINESYAYLPGRAGGQALTGGTAANDDLILNGTSSATKTSSYVILQPDGGNVGVGIKTPSARFHIKSASTSGATGGLRIEQSSDTTYWTLVTAFNSLYFGHNGVSKLYIDDEGFTTYDGSTGFRYAHISANSNPTYILNNSVGVNIISPTAQLHTTGTVRFAGLGAGTLQTDSGGNVTAVSDPKYKTNIKEFKKSTSSDSAIDAILKIVPICHKYSKDSGFDTQNVYCGFDASNLKAAIPESVFTKDDVKYEQKLIKKGATEEQNEYETVEVKLGTQTMSVSDRAIIAVLVQALKEEDAKVTALEARVTALEKKLGV